MRIKITPSCCDCCGVYDNEMECPSCGKKYAGTGAYYDLNEAVFGILGLSEDRCILECDSCGVRFRLIGDSPYDDSTDQWERMGE